MKQHIIAALISLIATQSIAAEQPEQQIIQFCNLASVNVLIAYDKAKNQESMASILKSAPEHASEIIAGYKLYESGKTESEAYQIFYNYCLNVMREA